MADLGQPAPRHRDVALSRVDDEQRNAALDELSAAAAAGRLSDEEFDERAGLALRARTRADLEALLTDLDPGGAATMDTRRAPVVSLTAAELTAAVAFAVVTGIVAWVVGGYAWPYQYGQRLLLWLFGLACGASGAALRRRH